MMHKKVFNFVVCLVIVGMSAPVMARSGKGPHQDRDFISELGLDGDVLEEIREIRQETRYDKLNLKFQLQMAKKRLKDLLGDDSPSESEVMDAVEEVGKREIAMRKSRLKTMLKIKSLLSREQRDSLRELRLKRKKSKKERRGERRSKRSYER